MSSVGSRKGVSLIELLAALSVLTIGLLGSVHLYYFGIDKIKAARETSAAVRAIRNEVEYLRAQPFATLAPGERFEFAAGDRDLQALPKARPELRIEDVPGKEGRLKQVTVAVAWTGEHGRIVRKSITTLVAAKEGS